jgi:hypothetical protein
MLGRTVDVNVNGFLITGKVTALDVSTGSPLMTVTTARARSRAISVHRKYRIFVEEKPSCSISFDRHLGLDGQR